MACLRCSTQAHHPAVPRVIQLRKAREAVEVVEVALQDPGGGEVLLRIEACALGQLDWNLLTLDAPPRLPLVPGHEAVGIVEAIGPDVTLKVGTRVLVTPLASSCGACTVCRNNCARHCLQARWRGVHVDGVLGTHAVVPAAAVVALSSAIPFSPSLALCGGSLWTAVGALRALNLVKPSRVVIIGVGGVGHLSIQVARAFGHEVFAVDVDPARIELGLELGALKVSGLVDAAVVCTPSAQALQQAMRLVKPGGHLALVGSSLAGRVDLSLAELVWRGLTLHAGILGSTEDLAESIALYWEHQVRPRVELVNLDAVPERLWALRDLGFSGRLIVLP